MFDDLIINDSFDIFKFLNKLNLDLFYTKPQFRHLVAFVLAMVLKGFNGKVPDANEVKQLEITWIYNQATQGVALKDVLKS